MPGEPWTHSKGGRVCTFHRGKTSPPGVGLCSFYNIRIKEKVGKSPKMVIHGGLVAIWDHHVGSGLGEDALGSLVLCCPIPIHGTRCVLRVALAGGREMIKAAFDEAKINKQAGNCAGLYLVGMTARSRRGEAAEAGSHIKGRDSAGCEGTTPSPLLQRVFLGPKNPGRSMCLFLIAGPHPMPAGSTGMSRRCSVPW